jgi:pyruvate formate lyase activating enzyme
MFEFQTQLESGKIRCDICPRFCELNDGQRGLCFVRQNIDQNIVCTTYGKSSGFCIDPIEKKPLYHYYPGSSILSFGTAGCNLTCKFCQNWDMSKARMMDILQTEASPEDIVVSAINHQCRSVAFTYNDPVIFYEYAIDTAMACREEDINSVAITAGYINPEPAIEFFKAMDAVNIDLKGFTEKFYHKLCGGSLQPVLELLLYLVNKTDTWVEITTLLIPGENDSEKEMRSQCEWIFENLGPDIPLHLSAFHPDYKLMDIISTPLSTLISAKEIAINCGLNHVYLGNVNHNEGSNTLCHKCGSILIERNGYNISKWSLDSGECKKCGTACPGNFNNSADSWGNQFKKITF